MHSRLALTSSLVLRLGVLALAAARSSAQISELFLNEHGNGAGTIYVVQGGVIQRQWSGGDACGSLVVTNSVRTAGDTGGAGEEFTLAGVATGVTFPAPGTAGMHVDDSTTDGSFIYGWDYASQRLMRFAFDWSNPTQAFAIVPNEIAGVAYDPTDGTFWLAGWLVATVEHRSATGALLGSFPVSGIHNVGLALDMADGTLWLTHYFTDELEQRSKSGQLLATLSVTGLPADIAGAEFKFVPGCSGTAYCTAGTTTHGCNASMSGSGTASATASSGFTIAANGVEGQKAGLLFYGVNGRLASPWFNGTSFLCVKAPAQRTGVQSSGGTADACDGVLALDWNTYMSANPLALGQPLFVGQVIDAQAWFRDPQANEGTNLSNGLEFSVCP